MKLNFRTWRDVLLEVSLKCTVKREQLTIVTMDKQMRRLYHQSNTMLERDAVYPGYQVGISQPLFQHADIFWLICSRQLLTKIVAKEKISLKRFSPFLCWCYLKLSAANVVYVGRGLNQLQLWTLSLIQTTFNAYCWRQF